MVLRTLFARVDAADTVDTSLQTSPEAVKEETQGLRIAAVFIILSAGLLGGLPPLVIPAVRNQESLTTFLIRAFSAGVILALALVHIVPDAIEDLANIGGTDYPVGGTSILFGIAAMVFIEHGAHLMYGMPHAHGPGGHTADGTRHAPELEQALEGQEASQRGEQKGESRRNGGGGGGVPPPSLPPAPGPAEEGHSHSHSHHGHKHTACHPHASHPGHPGSTGPYSMDGNPSAASASASPSSSPYPGESPDRAALLGQRRLGCPAESRCPTVAVVVPRGPVAEGTEAPSGSGQVAAADVAAAPAAAATPEVVVAGGEGLQAACGRQPPTWALPAWVAAATAGGGNAAAPAEEGNGAGAGAHGDAHPHAHAHADVHAQRPQGHTEEGAHERAGGEGQAAPARCGDGHALSHAATATVGARPPLPAAPSLHRHQPQPSGRDRVDGDAAAVFVRHSLPYRRHGGGGGDADGGAAATRRTLSAHASPYIAAGDKLTAVGLCNGSSGGGGGGGGRGGHNGSHHHDDDLIAAAAAAGGGGGSSSSALLLACPPNHCHDCVSRSSAPNWASAVEVTASEASPLRLRILAYLFELGCIFHSFIIGLSLGVNQTSLSQVRALLLALSFHQALEGLSLASVINRGGFSPAKAASMVAMYSITCPAGVAIGIAIAASYDPDSLRARAAQGVLNGVSGGMLLYISLVQLVAEDMGKYVGGSGGAEGSSTHSHGGPGDAAGGGGGGGFPACRHGSAGGAGVGARVRIPSFLAFCAGAAFMCMLAVWA